VFRLATASFTALSIAAGIGVAVPVLVDERPAAAADVAPVRILPLGDSITWGMGSVQLGSYRIDLAQRLAAAGVAVDMVGSNQSGPSGSDVDNEGHTGWRIGQIAEQADAWMSAYQPDVVLLHIGTNDMRSDDRAAGAAGRLAALIDQLLAASPDVQILVAKIIGAKDQAVAGAFQRRIDAYNAEIPSIVAARSPRVHMVDQTGVDGTDVLDMLHPNEFGYRKMAWTWYRALQPVLAPGATHWPETDNPFLATSKYIRQHTAAGAIGRWWHLRTSIVDVDGKPVRVERWLTLRMYTVRYRVKVAGKGQKPRYVTRTRTVHRWSPT